MVTRMTTIRGGALTHVVMLTVLATSAMASPRFLDAQGAQPVDAWLKTTAKHRQLFDAPAPGGGIPLIHMLNYYDTWNKAYGVADKDVLAVGTFYGTATFFGVNDAMWAKYRLGEFLGERDGAGTPATKNPWRDAPVILGGAVRPASIESLQKRGARFILCNNALGIFADMLAKARGAEGAAVYADLKANILPGVELVPGMVVAIEQAHSAGFSYHRQ
jgi:intracellular sulfur oxidation DsrE/DsrF family protein